MTIKEMMPLLPGLDESYPETFGYLARLLGQDQFELLKETDDGDAADRRVVYLMNDTVESFLVLREAVLAGEYDPDYEGELQAQIHRRDNRYVLAVHQGEKAFTLTFSDLQLEYQLYNYSKLGHFWVRGFEHLRVLEYQIAVLHDKYEYIGKQVCTAGERSLASLRHFPPLGSACYPAAPEKYVVTAGDPWYLAPEAAALMLQVAAKCQDRTLIRLLELYRMFPVKALAKYIAKQLTKAAHFPVIRRLFDMLREATAGYADRRFERPLSGQRQRLFEKAREEVRAYKGEALYAPIILSEEPFVKADDGMKLSVYVMHFEKHGGRVVSRVTKVEE